MSKELARELTNEVCALFPKETEKYHKLIEGCVSDILNAMTQLPDGKGMSLEQYAETVRKSIRLVKDGKLD